MLLAGIAVNALCGAGIGLFTYLSDDVQLRQLTFWTMGSLGGSAWDRIIPALVVMTGASFVLIRLAPRFNVFVLGEREAEHLGLDVPRFLKLVVIMVSLGVGAAVAVSGLIGFIGLVVPHLVRLLLGPDHRRLLPASAVLGAVLITAADTVARTAVSPAEMPIGLLCSAVGGPFFLWLLSRRQKGIGL
jgi:iron complex transport system permease protein